MVLFNGSCYTGSMDSFIEFLKASPTAWHAAREICNELLQAGFVRLHEGDRWTLKSSQGYFLMRDDALVAAFRMPKGVPERALLLASHLDSPALKLKPSPQRSTNSIEQMGTEMYGGPMLHAWLDRDLAIAGRIVTEEGTELVYLDETPFIIPQLAIHLDKASHEKGLVVHKQDHLQPICTIRGKGDVLKTLLKKQPLSFDLFLVPIESPRRLGMEKELLGAYRLDNLTSAYACLQAIKTSKATHTAVQMALFWDHEEVGSQSYLGAESHFVDQVLERICMNAGLDRENFYQLKSRSLCASSDLAHGFHPSYADKYDPQNASFLGKGVVIKHNANQKYATSAPSAAWAKRVAKSAGVPLQPFASRSDIPSGSTVGSIMASRCGIPTVDLGISGWAMHSTREVIALEDEESLCKLLHAMVSE